MSQRDDRVDRGLPLSTAWHSPIRIEPGTLAHALGVGGLCLLLLMSTGCAANTNLSSNPNLLASTVALNAATGATILPEELLHRAEAADFVLLGEIHDNSLHHSFRSALLTAAQVRRPAVVFEQFPRTIGPIPPPAAGESKEVWLDANGFDKKGWEWPQHAPIVSAAIAHAREIWGSGLSRDALSMVVQKGTAAAPFPLGDLIRQVPLDQAAQAAMDRELFEGHCGKLPADRIPGMRAAQEVRDASMAETLMAAGAAGPAWLIAGNGHVRMDIGVPRFLRRLAPARKLLVVGIAERGTKEAVPGAAAGQRYEVLIVTAPATREDPCAGV